MVKSIIQPDFGQANRENEPIETTSENVAANASNPLLSEFVTGLNEVIELLNTATATLLNTDNN